MLWGISALSKELLVSQEGLCCMGLVRYTNILNSLGWHNHVIPLSHTEVKLFPFVPIILSSSPHWSYSKDRRVEFDNVISKYKLWTWFESASSHSTYLIKASQSTVQLIWAFILCQIVLNPIENEFCASNSVCHSSKNSTKVGVILLKEAWRK
jgi:hypothetical protein